MSQADKDATIKRCTECVQAYFSTFNKTKTPDQPTPQSSVSTGLTCDNPNIRSTVVELIQKVEPYNVCTNYPDNLSCAISLSAFRVESETKNPRSMICSVKAKVTLALKDSFCKAHPGDLVGSNFGIGRDGVCPPLPTREKDFTYKLQYTTDNQIYVTLSSDE